MAINLWQMSCLELRNNSLIWIKKTEEKDIDMSYVFAVIFLASALLWSVKSGNVSDPYLRSIFAMYACTFLVCGVICCIGGKILDLLNKNKNGVNIGCILPRKK